MTTVWCDATHERSGRPASERAQVPGSRTLADRRNHASREQLLHRVRAEFDELRGLKLTLAQAQRLFGVREDVCQRVLNALIREGLLRAYPDQLIARRDVAIARTVPDGLS